MNVGSVVSILRSFSRGGSSDEERSPETSTPGSNAPSGVLIEGNETYFLSAETILARPQCAYYVSRIKELAGLSDEYFDKFYRPVLNRFAVLCQDVGASVRHHHSHPFGLIEHSLEVAMFAMRKAQGCVYYPDGHVETIQWLERVFMYSVFCAGLLHDGGKLYTNIKWSIRGADGDWKRWSPLTQTIPEESERVVYRALPYQNKAGKNVYLQTSHELFAANILLEVLPSEGVEWILSYSDEYCAELFIHFIHTLASDYDNGADIGSCVKRADQKSTDDAIKRMRSTGGSQNAYVDFSDPNLPAADAFRAVFAKMFADPREFRLTVNAVAMGKFSHIERFGDLLFVSAKGVLPIANRLLKENAVKIPNDQAVFTLLSDNGITLPAPSGDTLWWCEFFSRNNNNKSKEIAYLVFDIDSFPGADIADLREVGVEVSLGAKTLGPDIPVLDTIEETLSGHPALLEKLCPGYTSNPGKRDVSDDAKHSDADSTTSDSIEEGIEVKQGENAPVEHHNPPRIQPVEASVSGGQTGFSDSEDRMPFGQADTVGSANNSPAPPTVTPTPARTPLRAPPAKDASKSATPKPETANRGVTPPPAKTSEARKPETKADQSTKPKQGAKGTGNVTTKPGQKPQKKSNVKGSRNKGDLVATGLSKALGLDENDASPASTPPPAKSHQSTKPKNEAPTMPGRREDQSTKPLAEPPVATMPDEPDLADRDTAPFLVPKIKEKPQAVVLDKAAIEEAISRPFLNIPHGLRLNDGSGSQDKARRLVSTWLPYIGDLLTKDLCSSNDDEAAVFHLREGTFIVKEPLDALLDDELVRDLFSCVTQSSMTIVGESRKPLVMRTRSGKRLNGYLLATRSIKKDGKPLPLDKDAAIEL